MKDIVSFEKAKALKAAGVKINIPGTGTAFYNEEGSLFVLGRGFYESNVFRFQCFSISNSSIHLTTTSDYIRAFTTSELLEMLSPQMSTIKKEGGGFVIEYYKIRKGSSFYDTIKGDHLADTLADVLLQIKQP